MRTYDLCRGDSDCNPSDERVKSNGSRLISFNFFRSATFFTIFRWMWKTRKVSLKKQTFLVDSNFFSIKLPVIEFYEKLFSSGDSEEKEQRWCERWRNFEFSKEKKQKRNNIDVEKSAIVDETNQRCGSADQVQVFSVVVLMNERLNTEKRDWKHNFIRTFSYIFSAFFVS